MRLPKHTNCMPPKRHAAKPTKNLLEICWQTRQQQRETKRNLIMRRTHKLIIGLAILAASITGMHAYPYAVVTTSDGVEKQINLEKFTNWTGKNWRVGELNELGRNHGVGGFESRGRFNHKHIHLPAYLNTVQTLDLRGNDLTSFVVPPGMVQLYRIKLSGNMSLTNLVLQQDTGVVRAEYVQGFPEFPASGRGVAAIWIEFGDVGLKSISAPEWLNGRIHYDVITFKRLLEIRHDWRPSGPEVVRWRQWFEDQWIDRVYVCWGPGVLQSAIGFPFEFYDSYPGVVERERNYWNRRTKLASPNYGSFGFTRSGLLKIFRVRKNTGDVYKRPTSDIPIKIIEEVDLEIPKVD